MAEDQGSTIGDMNDSSSKRLSPLSLISSVDEKSTLNIEFHEAQGNISIPVSPRMKNGLRVFSQSFLYACRYGLCRLISELLFTGIDINCRSEDGLTGLMIACTFGQEEVVTTLLKYHNININISMDLNDNGKKFTALDLAIEGNYYKIVQIIKDYISDSKYKEPECNDGKENNPPLRISNNAIQPVQPRSSTPDSINALTSNENSPSGTTGNDKLPTFVQQQYHQSHCQQRVNCAPAPLNFSHSNQLEGYSSSIEHAASSYQTPQRLMHSQKNMGNHLAKSSVSSSSSALNNMSLTSIKSSPATSSNNITTATSSSSYYPISKWTPLMTDCRNGNIAAVRQLLESYVSVNDANDDGWTALMVAARFNNSSIINLLLQYGADLNATNKFGWTSLMMASRHGSSQAVTCLIKSPLWRAHNASINYACREGGWTALILAARHNEVEVARTLLVNGAQVNQQNQYGDTSIMWAARNSNLIMTKLLLEHGADPRLEDNRGRNSMHWVRDKNSAEMISLLHSFSCYDRPRTNGNSDAALSAHSQLASDFILHPGDRVQQQNHAATSSMNNANDYTSQEVNHHASLQCTHQTSDVLLDLQNKINFKGFELGFWATDNASVTTSLPSSVSVSSGLLNNNIYEITPSSSDNSDVESITTKDNAQHTSESVVTSATFASYIAGGSSSKPANWADAEIFTPQKYESSHPANMTSTNPNAYIARNALVASSGVEVDTYNNNVQLNGGNVPFSLFGGPSKSHYGKWKESEGIDDGYFADNQSLEGQK